ncbi:hypothetical protein [Microbispora sp. GKU 823]|uniref:hypothetical protein n=1 Tax=Microbispora sp. GKU 823 TaxID=1652100 RepID=UPI0009A43C24|nr:hypothetical protein [Microbispora sp. GKU 823]OPG12984.1 hypothetical protein B1L11_11280 [Microbispora sp. GKU 823]
MLRLSFRALGGVGLAAALLVAVFGATRAADLADGQASISNSRPVGVYAYGYPAGAHPDGCDPPRCR